jgi:hypothetical protein
MVNIDCVDFGIEEEFWTVLPRRVRKRDNYEDEISSIEGYPVVDQCGRYARKKRNSVSEIDCLGFFADNSKERRGWRAIFGTEPEGFSLGFLPRYLYYSTILYDRLSPDHKT